MNAVLSPQPDEVAKLYQQVAARIGRSIREGAYGPGERLPSERDLADELKVSRPTVREAMIALEACGVVEARQRAGFFVTDPPSDRDYADGRGRQVSALELIEARRLIEIESCVLAAASIDDPGMASLEAIVADMSADLERSGDCAERRFQAMLAQATGNGAIVAMIDTLWETQHRALPCRLQFERSRPQRAQRVVRDHQAIVAAIRTRDARAIRRAVQNHIENITECLLSAIEAEAIDRAKGQVAARRRDLARRAKL